SGPGLWVPRSLAGRLSLAPGGTVRLSAGGGDVTVPVAGVYQDLPRRPSAFWRRLGPGSTGGATERPAILGDPDEVLQTLGPLATTARFDWAAPLVAGDLSLPQAERLARGLSTITSNLASPVVQPGAAFHGGGAT